MDEIAEEYTSLDFQSTGLQNRLKREALGITRRDIAAMMDVEESTVYRWEHGESTKRLDKMINDYSQWAERFQSRFLTKFKTLIADYKAPDDMVITNMDLHLAVPKPGTTAGTVFVFQEEDWMMDHAPAGLIRAIAGRILANLNDIPNRIFVRELESGMESCVYFAIIQPCLAPSNQSSH